MQIIKLVQNYYRVTAFVCAVYADEYGTAFIANREMSFRMMPDISIKPIGKLVPFCYNWKRGQVMGIPDGQSDMAEALKEAIAANARRTMRLDQGNTGKIIVSVEILEVVEQEVFDMEDLDKGYMAACIRFYLERKHGIY